MRIRFPLLPVTLGAVAALGCGPARGGEAGAPVWPDSLATAEAFGARRGLTPVRAILHVHSPWSHDACDGEPGDPESGRADEACLARLRSALCRANVGAAFLTDHERNLDRADSLAAALLFRPGDRRVTVGGRLAANRVGCAGDGAGVLLLAGSESKLMTVGLDSLPSGSPEERRRWYATADPGSVRRFHDFGATVLFPHPEDEPLAGIAALAPDLVELYNPHANFAPKHRESQGLSRLGAILRLTPFLLRLTPTHPDLALYAIFAPNRSAIDRWDGLLGRRMIYGYGASDAHENALPWTLSDGLRGDAYERMIPWVTNVLLVDAHDPVAAGDVGAIERALARGRFFVAIEAWGTPRGFDFRLEGPGGTAEMGATVAAAEDQRLVVEPPRVSIGGHRPGGRVGLPEPEVRLRLLRIAAAGRRTVVAESSGRIDVPVPGPGVYRVEVGIVPRHLAPYLDEDPDSLREVVWIYANPIRVAGGTRPAASNR